MQISKKHNSVREVGKLAKHDVSFNIPQRALGKADVEFQVKRDGTILGTLTVSNGSLVWFPRGTTYGIKMGWTRFDEIMQDHKDYEEKRKRKTNANIQK